MLFGLGDNFFGLLKAIVPIVLIVIWVLSQVMNQKSSSTPVDMDDEDEDDPMDMRPESLNSEIDAFLKEVARQRQGQPTPATLQDGGAEAVVVEAEVVKEPRLKTLTATDRSAAEWDRARKVLPSQGGVARHVEEHLDESRFAARAAHLAEEVREADDRMEDRLHEKFDHRVGQLTQASSSARTASPQPAAGLAAEDIREMLMRPDSIRRAMILQEILRRPDPGGRK